MPPVRKTVIFVDVDDTLVRSFGSKRIPITSAISYVRKLHKDGHLLYLWSSGGEEYCRATAAEFDISDCFVGYLPKPDVVVDDQHPADWRNLRWIHTNEASNHPDVEDIGA